MKCIYILDEFESSKKNGIGTFLREFTYCIQHITTNICIISFNSNVEEFSIANDGIISRILFPPFPSGSFIHHADVIKFFFKMYIPDSIDNLFFINHSPCFALLHTIKQSFPLSKLIFTIHDFGWTSLLIGNCNQYKKIIKNRTHDCIKKKYEGILSRYDEELKMYDIVDKVICLSQDTRELLIDTYQLKKAKIVLIPNGLKDKKKKTIDKKEVRKSLLIREEEKILLFVGRPIYTKGIDILLESLKDIIGNHDNTRLVIIGTDNTSKLENILSNISHAVTHITFTGSLSSDDLQRWYSIADIGIVSSYYEQCTYTGIEMMMYGLPIVATDGYGIRNMFYNNVNAKIAHIGKYGNKQEYINNLRDSIIELINSNTLCDKLSSTARHTYETIYDIKYMRRNYEQFIKIL